MFFDLKRIDFKNIDFKNVYEWPIYGRAIVLIIFCLGVFYAGYFFYFSSLGDEIYKRYKQEQDLKQQVKTILKIEREMKESVAEFPQLVNLLNQWQKQLISSNNLPDLLNQILKLGAANHIQFSLFAPAARTQQDDYFKVPIKVIMQGNYSQLANFISALANLSQLVSIGDFIFSKKNANASNMKATEEVNSDNRLTCELTIEVFSLANKK